VHLKAAAIPSTHKHTHTHTTTVHLDTAAIQIKEKSEAAMTTEDTGVGGKQGGRRSVTVEEEEEERRKGRVEEEEEEKRCCVCLSLLGMVADTVFKNGAGCLVLQCVVVCCSVLQCVAVCCSVLQCVAVCCSVLQCSLYRAWSLMQSPTYAAGNINSQKPAPQ